MRRLFSFINFYLSDFQKHYFLEGRKDTESKVFFMIFNIV